METDLLIEGNHESRLSRFTAENTIPAEMAAAMVSAWAEIGAGVVRNARNPHLGNSYADLGAVCELVKPVLGRHGLAWIQCPTTIQDNNVIVTAMLLHSSGGHVNYATSVPLGDKRTAQVLGSAITYGRKYQMKAVFGLADKDDDGEAASRPKDDGQLLAKIAGAKNREDLHALRAEVEECEDNDVRTAYRAARLAYKAK